MLSMTGHGRCALSTDRWEMTVELKSVNHRFLDISCRLPRQIAFLEDVIRRHLSQKLRRGHVDVWLTLEAVSGGLTEVRADETLARSYAEAAHRVAAAAGLADTLSVAELMRFEGVLQVSEREMDEDEVSALCGDCVDRAADRLIEMRRREGVSLRDDLTVHLDAAAALRERILGYAPGVVEGYRQRLQSRLAMLPIEPVDPARLAQEVALMADKCAIDEELSRLESHIGQLRAYLRAEGEIGKKMDFLIQEMNREANTIGSKASDAAIAQCVVDLKSEIEKLREQIQNVE